MSSLEMKNFFPSQSKWNFSSRVAFRNFRVGRSKGGFVLSKHLRIWNCSSLHRAHTMPSPFAMTFCTIEFMRNSQIFHSCSFQFQNFFWLIFFLFYFYKNNLWWNITNGARDLFQIGFVTNADIIFFTFKSSAAVEIQ